MAFSAFLLGGLVLFLGTGCETEEDTVVPIDEIIALDVIQGAWYIDYVELIDGDVTVDGIQDLVIANDFHIEPGDTSNVNGRMNMLFMTNFDYMPQIVLGADGTGRVVQGDEDVPHVNSVNWIFLNKEEPLNGINITAMFDLPMENTGTTVPIVVGVKDLEYIDYGDGRRTIEGTIERFSVIHDWTQPFEEWDISITEVFVRFATVPTSTWILDNPL